MDVPGRPSNSFAISASEPGLNRIDPASFSEKKEDAPLAGAHPTADQGTAVPTDSACQVALSTEYCAGGFTLETTQSAAPAVPNIAARSPGTGRKL